MATHHGATAEIPQANITNAGGRPTRVAVPDALNIFVQEDSRLYSRLAYAVSPVDISRCLDHLCRAGTA